MTLFRRGIISSGAGRTQRAAKSEAKHLLKREIFQIGSIYVPTKRRTTLDNTRVNAIAESMLVSGQTTPIMVREDGVRFVLVEGLHRLEAARALGEKTIIGYRVDARKH